MTIQYTPTELMNKIAQNNYSYTNTYMKKMTETNTSIEKLQDKADTFNKKLKELKRYTSGGISRELLSTQTENFIKAYNDMKTSSGKVTDKDVQKQITKLEKLFSDNEKNLKKIGIEKVNGKYTFDSDTFEEASDKYIDTLFVGHDSFIGQADKIMRNMEETTDNALYDVTEHRLSRTLKYQESDMDLVDSYMKLDSQTTSAIKAKDSLIQAGTISSSELKQLLSDFASSVYRTDSAIENENIDKLNKLCLDHKDKLSQVGLTFDTDQKTMFFDDRIDMTTNEFKTAYKDLFGQNAVFGNTISEYCKNIFNDIISPDKLGVSIIDQYA